MVMPCPVNSDVRLKLPCSSAMRIISTLLLPFIAVAFTSMQSPAPMGQSKDNLSVSIKDLRDAATEVVLDRRSLSLSTYPWRDFMPTIGLTAGGSPLMVVLKVATADKKPLPSGVRIDRAWVLFGEQVWEASDFRAPANGPRSDKDSWVNCAESPVCEATVRGGPKWGPGVFVDVVVRLTDKGGQHHLLRAPKQSIMRTD